MRRIWILLLLFSLCLCACHAPAAEVPTTVPHPAETTEPTLPKAVFSSINPNYYPQPTQIRFEPDSGFRVEDLLSTLSTEEKVGQLFLARCPDIHALQDIRDYHLGGYILFGRDFANQTSQSICATIDGYQSAATIPLLIAVDEEGGTVTRVSSWRAFRGSRFPSPRNLLRQGGLTLLLATEAEKCALLRSLGINVNMAPVCDITTDSRAFMYSRSLGLSPEETAETISAMVTLLGANQIGSVLKHFPGYGNNTDTHTGIAVDNRSLTTLEEADLLPFAAGIEAGCGAVLVSHTIIQALDPAFPASLSHTVLRYLRNEMEFDGVIITDDLAMGAITALYGAEEAAVLAVLAGNDLLCSSQYQLQYNAVLDAVNTGRIPAKILDQAVSRVLRWKHTLGLLP